jgi:hypothetical protein
MYEYLNKLGRVGKSGRGTTGGAYGCGIHGNRALGFISRSTPDAVEKRRQDVLRIMVLTVDAKKTLNELSQKL